MGLSDKQIAIIYAQAPEIIKQCCRNGKMTPVEIWLDGHMREIREQKRLEEIFNNGRSRRGKY